MEAEILEGLRKAIMECNSEGAKKWAEKVVEKKRILSEPLTP